MADPREPSSDLVRQVRDEVAGEASEELGRLVGTIFGSAGMEVDQILGNEVGYFRLKRALRIGEKTRKLLAKHGLEPHQVPHRTSVPLLEAASLEDDDELQDRWAALLANATSQAVDVPPSFANVLRELDPISAKVLDSVYADIMQVAVEIQSHFYVNTSIVQGALDIEQQAFEFHVDNLVRLGILRLPTGLESALDYEKVGLTPFGRGFVRACQPPGTPEPRVFYKDRTELDALIAERKRLSAEAAAAAAVQSAPDTEESTT